MMIWEPRSVPVPTPETAQYWQAAAEGELLLKECNNCELVYHYPRALCPDCFSDDVEWIEASGDGIIYSYTVAKQLQGWPEDELPVLMAFVELDEGPRLMTVLRNVDPSGVRIGMPVSVLFSDTKKENIGIPLFEPANTTG